MSVRSRETKEFARREFDQWAKTYDRSLLNHFLFRPAYLAMLEEIARWRANHQREFRVLDIGCGTASFASLLRLSGWPVSVIGLDLSQQMCETASRKFRQDPQFHSRIKFCVADSEHLPFDDGSFDIVTCANSFHHYPHQQLVVRNMHRVLSNDGRLVVVDGFRDNVVGWVAFDVVVARMESGVHHAAWTTMRNYFETAQFKNVRQKKAGFMLPLLVTAGDR